MAEPDAGCRLRIVGIGSPFGADRLGWDVIDMAGSGPLPDGVEAVRCANPLSELPALMRGVESVFLVDALAGVPPGTVVRCTRAELRDRDATLSSHGLSVDLALDLAEALGELPRSLRIFGLGIGVEPEADADQALAAVLPHYAAALHAAIRSELHDAAQRPRPRGAEGNGEVMA